MKKALVEGSICIGPHFSRAEFIEIKENLQKKNGLDTLARLLSSAGNPQRIRILSLLHSHKEMCVCDLGEVLGISVSAVSQHLRRLKDMHVVTSRKDAQTVYYSLANNSFARFLGELLSTEETKKQFALISMERE